MAPGANKIHNTALLLRVVLGVNVEPGDFFNVATGWVIRNARDVKDSKAAAVVGLVGKTVKHVLVVVRAVVFTLVGTSVDGVLEVADIDDVGDVVAIVDVVIVLVVLVVEEDVLVPVLVNEPTLVSVTRVSVSTLSGVGEA